MKNLGIFAAGTLLGTLGTFLYCSYIVGAGMVDGYIELHPEKVV